MAHRTVPAGHLEAGQGYLEALAKLGLKPNFAGWGWDLASERWLLVLVTSIVDAGGPLALNKLLFKAYNANATPKEISPFIVRVFSPDIVPSQLYLMTEEKIVISEHNGRRVDPPIEVTDINHNLLGIEVELSNVYKFGKPRRNAGYMDRRQAWERFRRNVEELAA